MTCRYAFTDFQPKMLKTPSSKKIGEKLKIMTRNRRVSFASVLALATAVLLLTTAVVCVADVRNAYADDAAASAISVWDGTSSDTSWYDSSKTEFYITNAAQFAGFVAGANDLIDYPGKFKDKTVYITADIDLDNHELSFIYREFYGTLDGQGHTISNMKQTGTYGGLFKGDFHGTAKNIIFKNADITGSDGAGVFAYDITSETALIENIVIDSCKVNMSGNASPQGNAGGIVGWTDCTIKNCLVKNSTITSTTKDAGGIVGEGQKYKGEGLIYNCGSIGNTITAAEGSYAGKIIGSGQESGTTESCYGDGVLVGHNDGTYVEKNNRTDIATIEGFDLSLVSLVDGAKAYVSTKSFDNIIVDFVAVPSAVSVKENGEAIDFNLTGTTLSLVTTAGAHAYVLEYTVLDVQYTTKIVVGAPEAPQIVKTLDGAELANSSNFLINKDGVSYVCDTDSADSNQFAIGFASALAEGAKAIVKYGGNSVTITGSEKANLDKIATGTYVVEYYYYDGLISTVSYNFECLKSVGVDHLYYRESAENPWVLSDDVNGIKGMHSSESIRGVGNASSTVDIIAINTNHVSFNVASSSEGEWDCVKIYLNATEYRKKHGDEQTDVSSLSWEKVVFDLEKSDFNVITLTYTKDGSGDRGNDMGYVNNFCSRLVDVPTQAEYIITIDGKDSRKSIENGGTISVGYGKNTTLSLTAPILDGATCDLYLNGVKSDVALETEQGVYYFYIDDVSKYAEVQFVYDMEGYDPAPFTYNIDFVPSGSMQDNLVIGGNVTVDCSDYMQPCEVENLWDSLPCYPFGFNSKLSASKGWLVYSSTNQGIDSSISGIKLVINETGVLTFDYYISSDDSTAPNDAVYFRRDKAITNGYIQGDSLCFPLGAFYTKTSDEGYSNAGSRGEVGWQKFKLAVQQGQVWHIAYYKGGSVSAGDDTFAIANILLNSGVKSVNYSADDANGGSVSAKKSDGTTVASGESVVMGSEITLSATAKDGYKVYGWQNVVTGEFIASSSVKVTVVDNTEYKAIIKPIGTYTALVGNTLYATINEAQTANPEGTIYVIEDCTLTDFTLLQGVTLILTYSQSDRTGYAQGGGNARVSWNCGVDPYATLTVNGKLTLNGKLVVGGVQHHNSQSAQGHTSGAYAQMVVNGSVEIANGGYLDVRGRVCGSGTITANSGATIRQPFTVNNYAGGTNTQALYESGQFPFVQFATINVECKQIVNHGAKVIGSTSLYFWSSITTQDVVLVDSISNKATSGEGSLIWLEENSRLEISYDGTKTIDQTVGNIHLGDFGVTTIDVYGGIVAGEFSLQGYGSETMVLAIPYTYNFNIKDGASVTIAQKYKVMPGAVVTIEDGATINITENGALYVYDGFVQADKSGKKYPEANVLGDNGFAKSGMLIVNGTLNISGAFAGIAQTNGGGIINIDENATVGEQTITDGCNEGYTANTTTFKSCGRVYGINGFVNLEAGKNYKAYANNAFTLDRFVAESAERVDNLTVSLNQAMSGRFLEWNGSQFVATLTFYIGEKVKDVKVYVNGTLCQSDENGLFTLTTTIGTDGLIQYHSELYNALQTHSVTLDGNQQLKYVAKSVAVSNESACVRVYGKDGNIVSNFDLKANVSFYGTDEIETIGLDIIGELTGVFVTKNVKLSSRLLNDALYADLKVVTKAVAQFQDNVSNLASADDIIATASTLYAQYQAFVSAEGNKTADDIDFIKEYLKNEAKVFGNIAKQISAKAQPTYGDASVKIEVTFFDDSTKTEQGTLSGWTYAQGKISATVTFETSYNGKEYSLTAVVDNAARKQLTATDATGIEAVFNGQNHTATAVLNGIVGSDDVSATASFGPNAGEHNVTFETLTGDDSNFYTLANKLFKCTVKALDITVTVAPAQIMEGSNSIAFAATVNIQTPTAIVFTFAIYKDGTHIADVSREGIVSLVAGQTLGVGTYTVKALTDNTNYNITESNGTLDVVEANNYYSVDFGSNEKVYDGNVFEIKPTVTVAGTDKKITAFTVSVTLNGSSAQIKNVGTYNIVVKVQEEGKDAVEYNATFIVKAKAVTVKLGKQSFVYGDTVTLDNTKFTADGIVEGDNLDITLALENGAAVKNVGNYNIVGSANNSNYNVTFVDGENACEITKKAITLVIDQKSSVYGETFAALTASLKDGSSLAVGDTFESLGVSIAFASEQHRNVGSYDLAGSANNSNYNVTFEGEENAYTVTARSIDVIVANKSSVYGDALATLTATLNSGSTLAEGDTLESVIALGFENGVTVKNVDEYKIVGTSLSNNYNVTFTDATYTVTKRAIKFSVKDATSVYGNVDAAFVAEVTEGTLAQGESVQDVIAIARENGTNVGSYNITANAVNDNYAVTIVYTTADHSVYTVTKRPVTVTLGNASLPYTATWADLGAMLAALNCQSNELEGDDLNVRLFVLVGDVELTADNFGSLFAGGEYAIGAAIDNDNYDLTVQNGALTVGLPVVSVTDAARNITRVFGDTQNVFDWRTMLAGYLSSATDSTFRAVFYKAGDLENEVDFAQAGAGQYKMQIVIVHDTAYSFANGEKKSELIDVTVQKKDITDAITLTVSNLKDGYVVFANGLSFDASIDGFDVEILTSLTKDGASVEEIDGIGAYVLTATVDSANYTGTKTLQFKVVSSAQAKVESLKEFKDIEFLTREQYAKAKELCEGLSDDDKAQINADETAKANLAKVEALCANYAKVADNLDAIKDMLDAYEQGNSAKLADAHDYIVALDEEKLSLVKQSTEGKRYAECWQAAREEGSAANQIANKVRDKVLFGIVTVVNTLLAMAYFAFGKFRG